MLATHIPRIVYRSFREQYTRTFATNFEQWRTATAQNSKMASPSNVHLTVHDTGVFKFREQDEETAKKTSQLLQMNHESHHVFFNSQGFHNHITHHLLTLYGLGAPKEVIEKQYAHNASYQLPQSRVNTENIREMGEGDFGKFLGKGPRYADFLRFFQKEMEAKGWANVLKEFVFEETPKADDMLVRMFAGLLHPIIHLGFGVEFNQPAIVAEALAQAAVHDTWVGDFFLSAEKAAKKNGNIEKTLPELLDEVRNNEKVRNSPHLEDTNKLRDGVLKRAREEIIAIASQWIVTPETLAAKTVEMQNATVYFSACAQRPPKEVKFDFFYIHCVNSSIFWDSFNALSFLSDAQKVRLLEWKGRNDLALYASRGSPELLLEEVPTYFPKHLEAGDAEWPGLFRRMFEKDDDGHAVKLMRAVANAEQKGKKFENEPWAKIKGFMWEKVGNMVADSVEDSGVDSSNWIRDCGFEKVWEGVKDRPRAVHLNKAPDVTGKPYDKL